MSNRNYDNRVVIDRLQSINLAQNIYKYQQSGKTIISNPQTSNASTQRITEYREGVQELILKNVGAGYTVNPSGILNIVIEKSVVENIPTLTIPAPTPSPAPAPSPAPSPAYSPGTQLLTNPDFTDITPIPNSNDDDRSNGLSIIPTGSANGWTSSRNWGKWRYENRPGFTDGVSLPSAVTKMPIRTGVYPSSDSSGFVIFSYIATTISQTVTIDNLVGINTITGVLNIANVSNGSNDKFTFQIQYKDSIDAVLYTKTTNTTPTTQLTAPSSWTDYTLTFTRTDANDPNKDFDLIKSITINITGLDSGFWGGQYGPAIDYCRLTVS